MMDVKGKVVLVTGGGSGIGRGLAEAFHARGAKVIVAGRSLEGLTAVASANSEMETEEVDVADPGQVAALADRIRTRHGGLDILINNAGIQRLIDFSGKDLPSAADLTEEIDINFKGLLLVTNAFLPLLRMRERAVLVHVGSGLGFVPLAAAPVYSATKAAVHSFTRSLRWQLRQTGIRVVEIIPPVVETELHRGQGRRPKGAMKLADFVAAAMAGLDRGQDQVTVGLARIIVVASRFFPDRFFGIINKPGR